MTEEPPGHLGDRHNSFADETPEESRVKEEAFLRRGVSRLLDSYRKSGRVNNNTMTFITRVLLPGMRDTSLTYEDLGTSEDEIKEILAKAKDYEEVIEMRKLFLVKEQRIRISTVEAKIFKDILAKYTTPAQIGLSEAEYDRLNEILDEILDVEKQAGVAPDAGQAN